MSACVRNASAFRPHRLRTSSRCCHGRGVTGNVTSRWSVDGYPSAQPSARSSADKCPRAFTKPSGGWEANRYRIATAPCLSHPCVKHEPCLHQTGPVPVWFVPGQRLGRAAADFHPWKFATKSLVEKAGLIVGSAQLYGHRRGYICEHKHAARRERYREPFFCGVVLGEGDSVDSGHGLPRCDSSGPLGICARWLQGRARGVNGSRSAPEFVAGGFSE